MSNVISPIRPEDYVPTTTAAGTVPSAPVPGSPSNLDGYRAAMIIIKRLLDNAENDRPKTQRHVKTRSASFRAGYYRGLLTAHCMSALGEFPASNVDPIRTALEMENTEVTGDGAQPRRSV